MVECDVTVIRLRWWSLIYILFCLYSIIWYYNTLLLYCYTYYLYHISLTSMLVMLVWRHSTAKHFRSSGFAGESVSKLDSLASQIRIRIRALNGRFHWIQFESRFGFGKSNTTSVRPRLNMPKNLMALAASRSKQRNASIRCQSVCKSVPSHDRGAGAVQSQWHGARN